MTSVRRISTEEVWPLRAQVLRPGRPENEAIFAGDDLSTTTHWGAFDEKNQLAAVASLYRAPKPRTTAPAWQLRGMASAPQSRGQGYGAAVLRSCIEYLRTHDAGAVIWCNARASAVGFYLAHGFEVEGGVFEIPTVGPHFVMSRKI